jgi:hypothetical protein
MGEPRSSRMDQILDLLTQEIQARLEGTKTEVAPAPDQPAPEPAPEPMPSVAPETPEASRASADTMLGPGTGIAPDVSVEGEPSPPSEIEEELPTALRPGPHAARLMGRLMLGVFIALIVINIPLNRSGLSLARAMPDAASYIVRDGFVAKEEHDPDFYVYQNGKFRWISSLDAFEHYGYTWKDVHIVPDGYLDQYEIGTPIHVLLKCEDSPHIYRLEAGQKRWIRDIDTFTAEGHVWDDVRFVSCTYLRDLPDGETIPPGSGPPPQP